jgi:hypothetical protein
MEAQMALKLMPITETQPPAVESLVTAGRMTITPELAQRITSERNYARQRRLHSPSVQWWAEKLRRGTFAEGMQVWFVLVDGRIYLVDGQHRLHGVAASGIPASFQVEIIEGASADDVHEAYTWFDRGPTRKRSAAEAMNAIFDHDEHRITKAMALTVRGAALLLHFHFDPPHASADPVAVGDDHERLHYAAPYWPAAEAYERIVNRAPGSVRKRLRNPQIAAVALATLKEQPKAATEFWGGVAENDGLRKGDPRHTLLVWLSEHRFNESGSNTAAVAASLAWNSYYEGRAHTSLKVGAAKGVRIAGTNFRGERR